MLKMLDEEYPCMSDCDLNAQPSGKSVIRTHFIDCTTILAMAALFLLPAWHNGFPFIYPDTGGYLGGAGLSHISGGSRPIYYAWFTRVFDLPILVHSSTNHIPWHLKGLSPWPSVALQSLITAWIIWLFASALFRLTETSRLLLLALLLVLGTSLPWFVGQIMPDIFTALMIQALASLWLLYDTLPRLSRMMLVLLITAAVAFHQANLLVALWMLPAFALCALLGWRLSKASIHGILASGIGLTLGAALLVTANLVGGRFTLSNGGPVFLLARLLGDGTALSYLRNACPQRRFSVCVYLDELSSFRPRADLAHYFLWDGPLDRLGGFGAEESEAKAIVADTLSAYPLAQSLAAFDNGWRQLLSFRTGDGLGAYSETEFWSTTVNNIFGPVVYDHYLKSKQIRGVIFDQLGLLNYIDVAAVIASFLVVIGFVTFGRLQKQCREFFACMFVIILVVGNAFTLGALSGPSDRYQSRVIWLMPLLAICILLRRLPFSEPSTPDVAE
jgi:hypothetical protein